MPHGHAPGGLVSMQKCSHIRASSAPNFAHLQPLSAAQSQRGLAVTEPGNPCDGRQRRLLQQRSYKEARRADKRIRYSSGLLAVFIAVFFIVLVPMAAQASSGIGPRGLRLKGLLQEALSSKDPCTAIADAVKEGGVRVLAVDFDMTMITAHSGGSASDVPDNPIFTALSPDFDAFAAAVSSRGIRIAVVTFGDPKAIASRPGRIAGEQLVRRVLGESTASFDVDAVFAFYPSLYKLPADYEPLGLDRPMPYNKSFHIGKLLERFGVSKEEVLLIDDDLSNCVAFAADGGVSMRVGGDQGFDFATLEVI